MRLFFSLSLSFKRVSGDSLDVIPVGGLKCPGCQSVNGVRPNFQKILQRKKRHTKTVLKVSKIHWSNKADYGVPLISIRKSSHTGRTGPFKQKKEREERKKEELIAISKVLLGNAHRYVSLSLSIQLTPLRGKKTNYGRRPLAFFLSLSYRRGVKTIVYNGATLKSFLSRAIYI